MKPGFLPTAYSLQQHEGPDDQQEGDTVCHNPDHLVGSTRLETYWEMEVNGAVMALGQWLISKGLPPTPGGRQEAW